MKTTIRRTIFTSAAVLSLAACGGDDDNGSATDPIVGTWALSTMAGVGLPVPSTVDGNVLVVNSGSMVTADGGAFTATYNGTINGVAAELVVSGIWEKLQGSLYNVGANSATLNGVSVAPTNSVGTLSGNTLTVEYRSLSESRLAGGEVVATVRIQGPDDEGRRHDGHSWIGWPSVYPGGINRASNARRRRPPHQPGSIALGQSPPLQFQAGGRAGGQAAGSAGAAALARGPRGLTPPRSG